MNKSRRYLLTMLVGLIVIFINGLMLYYANTLLWPYFWPRPGIFVVAAVLALLLWVPETFEGIWPLRVIGLCMLFIGECYVLHSFHVLLADPSLVALIHFVGILGTFAVMALSYANQLTPVTRHQFSPLPVELPEVAAVIPTYGEPIDILEDTLKALKNLDYPSERLHIIISDDGHRREAKDLALRHGVYYNPGARKDAKAGNLNSALRYLDEHFPNTTLILTQDADEIIDPSFLQKTVGYFNDDRVGFVQTPKDAQAPKGDPFGVRDRVFYDVTQAGRNGAGAAFSCGSGVVWRIAAVKSIGGFVTWNVVEDLTTSFYLHAYGWRSEYHNEILSIGLAPDDIPGLLKQRGTWAVDTWRLFLFRNPLLVGGLSKRQRLQYLELGLFYVTSAFLLPLLMLTPLLSLLTGKFVLIEGSALFPWIVVCAAYYMALSRSQGEFFIRMWQYWVGHFYTYHKAFWIALRSQDKKPSYKVTLKTRQNGFYGLMLWPQFIYLGLGVVAIIHGLFGLTEISPGVRLANVGILLFFMFMVSAIVRASFYGLSFPAFRLPRLARENDSLPVSAGQTTGAD